MKQLERNCWQRDFSEVSFVSDILWDNVKMQRDNGISIICLILVWVEK